MCEEEIIPKDVSQKDISISRDKKTSIDEQQSEKDAHLKERAEVFARRADLLKCIRKDLDRFIVGEDSNKLLLFLICTSKTQRQPLGAVVTGSSSAGKNKLVREVVKSFDRVHDYSRVTRASLDRLQQDMNNSILVIRELRGLQAVGAVRVMLSEGGLKLLTTNERGEVSEIETSGTPVFLTTTSRYEIDRELQNRIVIISLDESEKQTREILRHQAEDLELQDSQPEQPNPIIKAFLNILQPHNVAIPYAKDLSEIFPAHTVTARRDFNKLGILIRMSTILHQYQRRRVQDPNNKMRFYILADKIDFEYALDIGGKSLEQTLAGIQKRARQALEIFQPKVPMTTKEVATNLHISSRHARDILNALVNAGYLHKDESEKTHKFELRETASLDLTNLKDPLNHWDEERLRQWLQEKNLKIIEEAPQPQYVEPFYASKISSSSLSSNEEHQAICKTAAKHQAKSQIAAFPSVTHEEEQEVSHAIAKAVDEPMREIVEAMRKSLTATTFRQDEAITVCMRTGATKMYCSMVWATLIQERHIQPLPEGLFTWRQ